MVKATTSDGYSSDTTSQRWKGGKNPTETESTQSLKLMMYITSAKLYQFKNY